VGKALHLQEVDQAIRSVRREIASLPKQIAEIERALESHVRQLDSDKMNLVGNLRERKKIEADIQLNQQKISKLKDQMLGAKNNEQYRAFQKEIDFCENGIKECEDRMIQLMEEAEGLQQAVRLAESHLAEEKKVVDGRKKEAAHQAELDKAELARYLQERATLIASLTKPLVVAYERLAKRVTDGRPVAQVVEESCSACHMNIRPQFMADLRLLDEILTCENCRRILYIQPASVDVERQMNV